MRYFRAGQFPATEEPTHLPVAPGPKMLVPVTVLVDAADAAAATDCLNTILRNHETVLTNGPVLDWAFGPLIPYTPPDPYKEGMAFDAPGPDAMTLWQDLGRRIAERLGPGDADLLYDPATFGDAEGTLSSDAMMARIQAIVVEECRVTPFLAPQLPRKDPPQGSPS